MQKLLWLLGILALTVVSATAQSTTVTLQVTDTPDSQTWNNGTWQVTGLVPATGTTGPFYINGTTTLVPNQQQSGSLSGSGGASFTLTPNASIGPAGTQWALTVCPLATSSCYSTVVTIAGATQTVTLTPASIRISLTGIPYRVLAYADVELLNAPLGSLYYNTTSDAYRVCGSLVCVGGSGFSVIGGGGGGAVTSVFGRTGAVVAVATDYSNVPNLTLGDGLSSIVFNTSTNSGEIQLIDGNGDTVTLDGNGNIDLGNSGSGNVISSSLTILANSGGNSVFSLGGNGAGNASLITTSLGGFEWGSTSSSASSADTGISRISAKIVGVGGSNVGDFTGAFYAQVFGNGTNSINTGSALLGMAITDTHGTVWGSPTGGAKGANTINVQGGLFVNGAAVLTSAPVSSVFGRTGAVVATSGDYSVAQITGAAPLVSPSFSGAPTAPTATSGTSNTQIATTNFVQTALSSFALGLSQCLPQDFTASGSVSAFTLVTVNATNGTVSTAVAGSSPVRGVAQGNAISGATVTVCFEGPSTLTMDGTATAGDIAIPSTTTGGQAHDSTITSSNNIGMQVGDLGPIISGCTGASCNATVVLKGSDSFGRQILVSYLPTTGAWPFNGTITGTNPTFTNGFSVSSLFTATTTAITPSGSFIPVNNTTNLFAFGNTPARATNLGATSGLLWGSTTDATSTVDTSLFRKAAGVVEIGGGSSNTTGKLALAAILYEGTTFTTNAGCSETSLVGGASAGRFVSGTTGTCTTTVTIGNSATAPNGWSCWVNDRTTANLMRETADTTTTFTLSGTTVSGDVINFGCIGY